MQTKPTLEELNKLYDEGTSIDEELFSEMRSNVLLVSGNHYSKKSNPLFNKIRGSNNIAQSQKLRLTQNHVHKISRHYINSVLAKVPGVTVSPQNDVEMQDRKSAEINQAVWNDAKAKYKLSEKRREWAHQFVEIGEVACFIYYDEFKGAIKGYEQAVDEQGVPQFDQVGNPAPDMQKPVFEGGFLFQVYPWI